MGLAKGNICLASEFVALKARVKAECSRRNGSGSIASYAGSAYDYTVIPQAGNPVLPEHVNKLVEPLNAIAPTGYEVKKQYDVIPALDALEAFLTASENIPLTAAKSNCAASCTGLCAGTCKGNCSGCSGSCKGGCSGGCTSACTGCTGGCKGGCSGTCTGSCRGTCVDGCSATCSLSCKGRVLSEIN